MDVLAGAAGTNDEVEQGIEAIGEFTGKGVATDQGIEIRSGARGSRAQTRVPIDEGSVEAPGSGYSPLKEQDEFGLLKVRSRRITPG